MQSGGLMPGSVIVAGARTPIGRLLGSLKDFSAMDLGGFAIKAALERAGVTGDQIEYVIMGQVLQAGAGQITARQAAVKAGIPMNIPALTINKVCLSGLDSIAFREEEGVRGDTTAGSLSKLKPAFAKEGTITAGSASQISDGAAAVVVMSRAKAEELGVPVLAEIGYHGVVAGPDSTLQSQP